MIDAAKYADLVLLLIDAAFGFEMETFEFLNLLQVGHREAQIPRTSWGYHSKCVYIRIVSQ